MRKFKICSLRKSNIKVNIKYTSQSSPVKLNIHLEKNGIIFKAHKIFKFGNFLIYLWSTATELYVSSCLINAIKRRLHTKGRRLLYICFASLFIIETSGYVWNLLVLLSLIESQLLFWLNLTSVFYRAYDPIYMNSSKHFQIEAY